MRTITLFIMINPDKKNEILYLIKYLGKVVDKDFDARLAEYDLTGQQGRILFFIAGRTNIRHLEVHQNDIENEFHLSKSTVSGLVKRLEKKGVITIEKQHPYAILRPSEEGNDIVKHVVDRRQEAIDKLLKDFNEKEKKEVISYLNRLITNLEGGDESAK